MTTTAPQPTPSPLDLANAANVQERERGQLELMAALRASNKALTAEVLKAREERDALWADPFEGPKRAELERDMAELAEWRKIAPVPAAAVSMLAVANAFKRDAEEARDDAVAERRKADSRLVDIAIRLRELVDEPNDKPMFAEEYLARLESQLSTPQADGGRERAEYIKELEAELAKDQERSREWFLLNQKREKERDAAEAELAAAEVAREAWKQEVVDASQWLSNAGIDTRGPWKLAGAVRFLLDRERSSMERFSSTLDMAKAELARVTKDRDDLLTQRSEIIAEKIELRTELEAAEKRAHKHEELFIAEREVTKNQARNYHAIAAELARVREELDKLRSMYLSANDATERLREGVVLLHADTAEFVRHSNSQTLAREIYSWFEARLRSLPPAPGQAEKVGEET